MRFAVTFAIVLTAFVVPGSAHAQPQPPTGAGRAPLAISFCDLERNPRPYANARIQLTAIVRYAFEEFTVWDPTCPATDSDFSLWVTFGGHVSPGAIYCCPGEGMKRTEPSPFPLVADRTFNAFRSLLQREKDTVVHGTFVGTLLLAGEEQTADGPQFQGYGHFGVHSLFVIERVVSYEAHNRRDLDYTASAGWWTGRTLDCVPMSMTHEGTSEHARVPHPDGVQAFVMLQRQAEQGERAWAFTDPFRVALEEVESVYGRGVAARLKRTKSSARVQVFEWERNRQLTTVVVARPYWLSRLANGSRVAWVPTLMETGTCHDTRR